MADDNKINIYEFSTGIHAEPTQDGGWISRGFTGYYMNVTWLDGDIPKEIKRAIANKYFTVSEGGRIARPALIGRVIYGQERSWSVLAVVSRGIDDGGRPLSVYRYFFTEGDLFWKLIRWLEDYQNKNEVHFPVFDPLNSKSVGHYETFSTEKAIHLNLDENTKNQLINASLPLIYTDSQLEYQDIYWRSLIRSNYAKIPLAFAYNACALEIPRNFTIIHAANEEFAERIRQSLGPTLPALPPVSVGTAQTDEQMIKSAIKTLMNRTKPDAIKVIAEAMENQDITPEYWDAWFNAQGAKEALKQPISSIQMARLLTLRAFAIRGGEGKIDLEEWKKHPANQSFIQECDKFEKQFEADYPSRDRWNKKIREDVVKLFVEQILKPIQENKLKERNLTIGRILSDQEDPWGKYSKQPDFLNIKCFIEQIIKYPNREEREQKIKELQTSNEIKYLLKDVSDHLDFQRREPTQQPAAIEPPKFGVSQISKSIKKEVGEIINYCQPKIARFKEQPKTFPQTNQEKHNVTIPEDLEEEASTNLTTTTAKCLKQIVAEEKNQFFNNTISEKLIYILIIKALGGNPNNLKIDLILNPVSRGSIEEKQAWINMIYKYQIDKIDSPNGIMSDKNKQLIAQLKADFEKQYEKYEMAVNDFDSTKKSIKKIVAIVAQDLNITLYNQIYLELDKILEFKDIIYIIESHDREISWLERWKLIEAIELYQSKNDISVHQVGIISDLGKTYNKLGSNLKESFSKNKSIN